MDVVEDDGDVGEGVGLVEVFDTGKHTFVEFACANNEEGGVNMGFQYIGVDNQSGGGGVEDNVLIIFTQLIHEAVEASVAQQFGGVGRYGTGEEAVHTLEDEVFLDERLPIVGLAGKVGRDTGMFTRVELAGHGAASQVKVNHDDAFAGHAEGGGEVGRDEGLAHAGHQRGNHNHLALLFVGLGVHAEEVHLGTQQSERLRHYIVVAIVHHQVTGVVFCTARYLAEERRGGAIEDIVVVFHLRVEQSTQEEYANRNRQANQQTHKGGLALVGGDGGAVDTCGVKYLAIGLDGGLADHQLLTTAQQMQVKLLFDFLGAFQIFNIELLLRHLVHLAAGTRGYNLCIGDTLLQYADIDVKHAVHLYAQLVQLGLLGLHGGVVGGVVALQLKHQGIILRNHLHDVFVVEYAGGRYQVRIFAALVGLDKVAGHGELLAEALNLLRRLDACGQIALSERREVKQLVFALEACQGVFLYAQVGLQQFQTFVDIVVGVGDDALAVFDGIVVIHADDLVDYLGGTDGRCVLQHNIDDGVEVVVASYTQSGTVALGGGQHAVVLHVHRGGGSFVVEEPGGIHDHTSKGSGHGVAKGGMYRIVVLAEMDVVCFLILGDNVEGGIVFFTVVNEVYRERRLAVQVFLTAYDTCLGGIAYVEFQILCHLKHGRLGGKNHHLVVDGTIVE